VYFIIQHSHSLKNNQKSVKAFFVTLAITTTIVHWAAPHSLPIKWKIYWCSPLGVVPYRVSTSFQELSFQVL